MEFPRIGATKIKGEGVMKCDNCMTNLNPNWWNYCPNCGAKVVDL